MHVFAIKDFDRVKAPSRRKNGKLNLFSSPVHYKCQSRQPNETKEQLWQVEKKQLTMMMILYMSRSERNDIDLFFVFFFGYIHEIGR